MVQPTVDSNKYSELRVVQLPSASEPAVLGQHQVAVEPNSIETQSAMAVQPCYPHWASPGNIMAMKPDLDHLASHSLLVKQPSTVVGKAISTPKRTRTRR